MNQPAGHPDKLPWYVSGKLEAGEREEIRAHLRDCPDCARDVLRLESLRRSMRHGRKQTGDPAHLSVEDLVALESDSPGLSGPARGQLERHLEACAECREDFESLRAASRLMASQGRRLPAIRTLAGMNRARLMGLAAALLVAIAGFAAAMVFRQAPAERTLLLPGLRSSEQPADLPGPGPWPATVVLPFDAPDGVYSLAIEGPGGTPAGARLPRFVEASQGRFDTKIPPLATPGIYTLSVRPDQDREGAGWSYLLRVGASPAAATTP